MFERKIVLKRYYLVDPYKKACTMNFVQAFCGSLSIRERSHHTEE